MTMPLRKLLCLLLLAASLAAALGACAVRPRRDESATLYDFGLPARPIEPTRALPPLTLFDMQAAPWLETPAITYRFLYANALQARPYAHSRWRAAPPRLLEARLRQKLGRVTTVLASGETALAPVLRVTLEEFSQNFEAPARSHALVRISATVLVARRVVGGTTIERTAPAPSADAAGAAQALTVAGDAALDGLVEWLQTLPAERLTFNPAERAAR